jgi:hypothetical protein
MKQIPPLHFAVPVWGERYVKTFLEICLPAQLSPANIPALHKKKYNLYKIYTTNKDYERIEASPAFRALQRIISVSTEFIEMPNRGTADEKYKVKSDCYRNALLSATHNRAALLALNADIVLANGFVRSVVDLLSQGKRVIEVPGPRGLQEPIARALSARFRGSDGVAISIEPVDLSDLWVKNLHPQLAMHFVEGRKGDPFHPSHLYWPVGDEGVIIRGFHLYPIVVYPRDSSAVFKGTIDDDLVSSLKVARHERYLAQDSRRLFCCELSPPDIHVGRMADRGDLHRYIEFYSSYAQSNIHNLEHEIIVTGTMDLGPEWTLRRKQSAEFVELLLKQYRARQRRQSVPNILRLAWSKCSRLMKRLRILRPS